MINIRRAADRWHADRGWLKSRFTFSFADYNDPAHMGFRALRILNDDTIAAGKGFGPHAHRDMEILTYVLEGRLLHRDSMGEQHVLGPNEIQMMSAGTGVVHSEYNASETEPVHVFQIWILPEAEDLDPTYQQVAFDASDRRGRLLLLAAPKNGGQKPLTVIRQDARVYATEIGAGESIGHRLGEDRFAYVQVVKGSLGLNGEVLSEGDAAAVSKESQLSFTGAGNGTGEALLFDLA